LILDEPTTGLDPNQIIEIRNVIKQQGANKTVLFSTHILQEVQAVCNRVIIINKGRIVADDTVDNLQHQSDIQAVTVQFDQAINEDWLKNIPTVKFVDVLPQFMYCLKGTQPETIRKQLLELALNQNLNIISLQTDKQSLERIFKSLTSEN